MKTQRLVLLAAAGLLLFGTAAVWSSHDDRGVTRQADDWLPYGLAYHNSSGDTRIVPFDELELPEWVPTPTPSQQPSVPPPSATPAATATVEPTPTPEESKCWGTVSTGGGQLNVRTTPWGRILGKVDDGDILAFEGRQLDSFGTWWYRLWWSPTEVGYVSSAFIELSEFASCPWDRETAWGPWAGPGASLDELLAMGRSMQAAGIQPAATVYGARSLVNPLHDAGWVVMYRPWLGDCGDMTLPAEVHARKRMAEAETDTVGLRYDWLVLSNECIWPSISYAATYVETVGQEADSRGIERVVPLVWYSGAPELADVAQLAAAYHRENGELAWGVNLYPVAAGTPLDSLSAGAWTTYRPLMYLDQLTMPVVVTEFARGDGSEPPQWGEYVRFVQVFEGRVAVATAWYWAGDGGLGHWPKANARGQGAEFVDAIADGVALSRLPAARHQ